MITKISESTRERYKILFAQLSTLLMGYVETKTYTVPTADVPAVEYYYREDDNSPTNYVFIQDESITSIETFGQALEKHSLYIKAHKANSTEGWTGEEIGFVDQSTNLSDFSGITTVEEYLSWLAQLKDLNSDYVLRFSRMPLTEDCFEIDANTRTISIPADFRKNGIGVQGDDVAEDVYFIIDRFYDVVDLNNCEIHIKYETPKTKTKGDFEVLYKDITTEPGKIIFGWPITANVASEAGSLRFSIQFVQRENPDEKNSKIIYSFNTLTQNVAVQNSIGIDLSKPETYEVDQVGTRLIDRIKFSEIVGGTKAATPEFILEPEAKNYDLTDKIESINLTALATSSDTGAISYTWYRAELAESDKIKTDGAGNTVSGEVVESVLTPVIRSIDELQVGRVYYYYNDDTLTGNGTRYVVPAAGVSDDLQLKTFVERVSTCIVDKNNPNVTGAYYVMATNRITNSVGMITSKAKAIFPKPVQPVLEAVEATNDGFFVEEGNVELSVVASHLKEEEQSYQWKFKANKDDAFENIDGANQATYVATKAVGGKGSGYYTVEVTNKRNTESTSVSGEDYGEIGFNKFVVRVTSAPVGINWTRKAPEAMYANDITETSSFTAQLENIEDVEYDEVSVGWFVYEPNVNGENINEQIVNYTKISDPKQNKEFSLVFNSEIQKAIKEYTNNDLIAYYYPVVINTINGVEAKSQIPNVSDMFQIKPADIVEPVSLSIDEEDMSIVEEAEPVSPERVTLNKLFFED